MTKRAAAEPGSPSEVEDLRRRLADAEYTLRAIRDGEADALVIADGQHEAVHILRDGDHIYRQFIEAARGGTVTLSGTGDILSCDAGFAETLQRPIDEVVGTRVWDYVLPDDQGVLRALLERATRVSGVQEIRLVNSGGQAVPLYAAATILRSDDERSVECLAFTDVAEILSAEKALQDSADKLDRALDMAPTPMIIHADDGEILSTNRAWSELSGYSREETPTIADWLKKAFGARADSVDTDIRATYCVRYSKS